MSFTSLNFWLIFPFVFILYWLIPVNWGICRKGFLVLTSYLLYMNWNPSFALILFAVTLVTYLGGCFLDNQIDAIKRKRIVWLFAFLGLIPLLIFKYYNFVNQSLGSVLASCGLQFALPGLNWAVPIGISFYTFQALGYLLDVYHGHVNSEKNLLNYALFVSFFPQVMSGPISKAGELLPQINTQRKFDYAQGTKGLKALLWGMFIKLVIADRLGLFVDSVYSNYAHYNGATCFLASVFYSFQIYSDFAGYSLMAVGVAQTLGFDLIDNFRRPYLAVSITDFWKRWHISLTRWLTQHIYIPLGGNRHGKLRTYLNVLVTFFVSGVWHGANWTFIVWGCLHGLLQIVEKAFGWQKYEGRSWPVKVMRIGITFLFVNFLWILFRMPDISSAGDIFNKILTDFGAPDLSALKIYNIIILLIGLSLLVFKDIKEEFLPDKFQFLHKNFFRWSIYIALFAMILTLGVLDSGQFIYVNF